LAETECPLPNSQNLQREVYALTEENRLLKRQLDEARSRPGGGLAPLPAPAPTPASAQVSGTLASNTAPGSLVPGATNAVAASASTTAGGTASARGAAAGTEASHPRVYVVQAKDSIYSVASRYGLKASAVLAANPDVNPNRLRIGQSLNLP
jgi:LysM repeat protein